MWRLPDWASNSDHGDHSGRTANGKEEVIATLAITILVESVVITAYANWRQKPLKHLLVSSLCANLITQSFLWAGLLIFPKQYLITLFILEVCIWGMEAAILYLYPYNRLKLPEAILLSLVMNLVSLGVGWFLPV